jgi:hypothetical protein
MTMEVVNSFLLLVLVEKTVIVEILPKQYTGTRLASSLVKATNS